MPLWTQTPAIQIDSVQQGWSKNLGPAARNLRISSQEGILTVSGATDNLLTRDQALRIASSAPGVVQILDQVEIQPEIRPDAAIQQDVLQALRDDPALRHLNPQVAVNRGTVTLSGQTRSWGEKHLAEEVAKSVRGVGEIHNNLMPQPSGQRTDFELEAAIRQLLNADRTLAAEQINVQVLNGQATLSGAVKNLAAKQRAGEIARNTGANAVDSRTIQVQPAGTQISQSKSQPQAPPKTLASTSPAAVGGHGPEYVEARGSGSSRPSDLQLEREIHETLRHDPLLCGEKISVKVRNGRAFLSGRVKNIDHQAAAFSGAYIAGASRVDMTGLTLEQHPPQGAEMLTRNPKLLAPVASIYPSVSEPRTRPWNDVAIRDAILAAILHDPRLAPYMIKVDVEHGKVTLSGGVDNLRAKRLAGQEAARIQGVEEVNNRLAIHPDGKPADQQVAETARAAFQRDAVLAPGDLQVAVQQGQAVLSGTAHCDFQKAHAADVLSRLNGVVSVKDDIKLNPGS